MSESDPAPLRLCRPLSVLAPDAFDGYFAWAMARAGDGEAAQQRDDEGKARQARGIGYQNALVDVSDVPGDLAKAEGGFYDVLAPSARVGDTWLAVPHSIIGNAVAYRRSWLNGVGATEYPKTWDEARKVFTALKKRGKPYGQTLGHTWGDASVSAYPMLWSFGGAETDQTGRKVAINSKGTQKYIIIDMFAKAVQGMKPEDAVKWAEGEMKKVYEG